MLFQSRNQQREVQKVLVKLLNQNCNEVLNLLDGPREEGRINLTIAVYVIPWNHKRPNAELAFAATTRELSSSGLSIVVDQPIACERVIIGWAFEGTMWFARGKFRHQDPIGAGFWNAGVELEALISVDDYPELASIHT